MTTVKAWPSKVNTVVLRKNYLSMKREIKSAIYFAALGASLVAYAHANFSTKESMSSLSDLVKRIDNRVYNLVKHYGIEK